jgi:hypothetical protein
MVIEKLRSLHQAQPFQPFDMYLADGRVLHVAHPELLAIMPPGRAVILAHADGNFEIIDLLLVVSLKSRNGSRRRGRGRDRGRS